MIRIIWIMPASIIVLMKLFTIHFVRGRPINAQLYRTNHSQMAVGCWALRKFLFFITSCCKQPPIEVSRRHGVAEAIFHQSLTPPPPAACDSIMYSVLDHFVLRVSCIKLWIKLWLICAAIYLVHRFTHRCRHCSSHRPTKFWRRYELYFSR